MKCSSADMTGRIQKALSGFYYVDVGDAVLTCRARGKFRKEGVSPLVGDQVEVRVTEVKEDGKLDLSIREKIPQQMEKDAQLVLQVLEEYEGVLPFNDKVSPEIIERELHLSKNAFKRAVGHLLKEGKIEITEKRIFRK